MKKTIITLIALAFLAGFSSCVKDKLDSPPAGGSDPNITVNFSIDSLIGRLNAGGGSFYHVTENLVISGIVVGDDSSGNLYKQLAIEDSTGGVILSVATTGLYNTYPVGRRVFIKLNGLYIASDKGLYEICSYITPTSTPGAIPPGILDQYVFPGKWGIQVAPKVITLATYAANYNAYQSELLEFDDVEFALNSRNIPYATGYGIQLNDCNGEDVVVYTSSYADFATLHSPSGNGKFICLGSAYNGPQVVIRDPSDLSLNGPNCNQQQNNLSIAQLRALYTGSPVTLPNATTITGIVISDGSNGNIANTDLFVQDATGGMEVHFTSAHSFALGANITLNLSSMLLVKTNGGLQITNIPVSNATQSGTGTVTPRTATVAQVNQNASAWESTLVQITGATINGGVAGTYSGSHNISDGTGTAALNTLSTASFASTSFPTSAVSITCILAQNNGVQLEIRNTSDVQ